MVDATIAADNATEKLLESDKAKSLASYIMRGQDLSLRQETKLRDIIKEGIEEAQDNHGRPR